jgi:hypothetical protein
LTSLQHLNSNQIPVPDTNYIPMRVKKLFSG